MCAGRMLDQQREVATSFDVIREMLHDRAVDTASLERLAGGDVAAMGAGRAVFYVDLPSCATRVVYDLHPRFRAADVQKVLKDAAAGTTVLLVTSGEGAGSGAAHKSVMEIARDRGLLVQMWELAELQYNVSRHHYQPRFEPLRDPEEIQAVLARYRIPAKAKTRLNTILASDPLARYYALRPGQLARITRYSPSAGVEVTYRACIAPPVTRSA